LIWLRVVGAVFGHAFAFPAMIRFLHSTAAASE
jgi:Sec-independent protein secretion pathway component TatC